MVTGNQERADAGKAECCGVNSVGAEDSGKGELSNWGTWDLNPC